MTLESASTGLRDGYDARRHIRRYPRAPLAIALLTAACLAACNGEKAPTEADYVPSPDISRRALETSLGAWRDGKPTEPIPTADGTIETFDTTRDPAIPLQAYEILGPVGASGESLYAVRLRFEDEERDEVARYLVRGLQPIWVFRLEDFERISHWEHKMDELDPGLESTPAEHHPLAAPSRAKAATTPASTDEPS